MSKPGTVPWDSETWIGEEKWDGTSWKVFVDALQGCCLLSEGEERSCSTPMRSPLAKGDLLKCTYLT